MRSTAIVRISKIDCPNVPCPGIAIFQRPHPLYRAECADCGVIKTDHTRTALDQTWVQQHRRSCPQRPGAVK